jgi:glycine/D-amino acid oxidase-like deaminating enzyme
MPENAADVEVDVLVVGTGGGGMTAALTAKNAGLDVLLVEKSAFFGGSTALSGGGIWVPGAAVQAKAGYHPDPEDTFRYLKEITGGLVRDERLRAYIDKSPEMLDLVGRLTDAELVWKPGYPDYYPETPGGSARGSVINVEPIDLRRLGDDETKLLQPLALAPRGMWLRPLELRDFYTIRQSWRGKIVLLRFVWRMLRARTLGEHVAALGQALAAHLWLGLRRLGVTTWLNSPLISLTTADSGRVTGAVIQHEGRKVQVSARGGVILATGGFDHDPTLRKEHHPFLASDWSFGNPANTGDGIRAGQQVGAGFAILDEAWWYPTLAWPDGRLQFLLNERMMPAQFMVNGDGKRFINEATPYSDFGHAMIRGQESGVTHIPCWLITDISSWRRYVILGHLPLPKIPFAPAPTGYSVPRAWLDSGVVKQAGSWAGLAAAIGVPAAALEQTAARYNALAVSGHDDDFGRGDSVYDNYYGDPTLPNPNLAPLGEPPYMAFRVVLGDLGTNGGLLTDEHARVLRPGGSVIPGCYAVGNTSAAVMGRSYAGAGATIGPAMTFGYIAARHVAERLRASEVAV